MHQQKKQLSVEFAANVEHHRTRVEVLLDRDPIVEAFRGGDDKVYLRLLKSGVVRDESMSLEDFAVAFARVQEAAKELPVSSPWGRLYQQRKPLDIVFSASVRYDRLMVEVLLDRDPIVELFLGSDDRFYIRLLMSSAVRDESIGLEDFARVFAVAQEATKEISVDFPGE